MTLAIVGIGTVCSLGTKIDSFKDGLEGTIKPLIENKSIMTKQGTVSLPVFTATTVDLETFVPKSQLRRIDSFSRMALLSSYRAVEDAGIELKDMERIGVICGSGYGPLKTTFNFLDGIINDGDMGASPTHFANSVHNSPASHISILQKINGPCQTITCFSQTVSNVFLTAEMWLNSEIVDFVLVVLGDENCDVREYASVEFGASESSEIRPFCFNQCSYLPGEGFVSFLLSRPSFIKGKYGTINKIMVRNKIQDLNNGLLNDLDVIFLSAKGNRQEGETYRQLNLREKKVAAYSPVYGGMPIGVGFDIAAAALSLKEKKLFPCPNTQTESETDWKIISQSSNMQSDCSIGCIEYENDQQVNLFILSGDNK